MTEIAASSSTMTIAKSGPILLLAAIQPGAASKPYTISSRVAGKIGRILGLVCCAWVWDSEPGLRARDVDRQAQWFLSDLLSPSFDHDVAADRRRCRRIRCGGSVGEYRERRFDERGRREQRWLGRCRRRQIGCGRNQEERR